MTFRFCLNDTIPILPDNDDSRLVVQYSDNGHSIFTINDRLINTTRWYQGKGQININQNIWNPEWVDCSILLYNNNDDDNDDKVFSVLWEDEGSHFRHIMDFKRFIYTSNDSVNNDVLCYPMCLLSI